MSKRIANNIYSNLYLNLILTDIAAFSCILLNERFLHSAGALIGITSVRNCFCLTDFHLYTQQYTHSAGQEFNLPTY